MNFKKENIYLSIRVLSYSILAITFSFLINNILIVWFDWPGIKKLYSHYELFGFKKLNKPLDNSQLFSSYIQLFSYLISILLVIFYVLKTFRQNLEKDSQILSSFSAYIIRSAFWAVFLLGIIGLVISFIVSFTFVSATSRWHEYSGFAPRFI